jgi:hypothetical protein
MLGTVDDGVKKEFLDGVKSNFWWRPGMELHMTASNPDLGSPRTLLAARWRRQIFLLDAVTSQNLYILFYFSFIKKELVRRILGPNPKNPRSFATVFSRVFTPWNPSCSIEISLLSIHSICLCVVWIYLMLVLILTW